MTIARLHSAFDRARREGRAALIGYLPAGYPTPERSVTALMTLARHCDVLEVGLPHNRPGLEGPAIQRACHTALAAGTTPACTLDIIRQLRATVSTPVVLMSPWEPVAQLGPATLAPALAAAGACGIVLPDVHPTGRGASRWRAEADEYQLATTFLAADGQRGAAGTASTGWVYLPAVEGPSGTTKRLNVRRLRRHAGQLAHRTRTPICAGIGLSSPGRAAMVAPSVDGVVIGSAFVRAYQYAPDHDAGTAELALQAARFGRAVYGTRGEHTPLAEAS